jgi:hypothetical protein
MIRIFTLACFVILFLQPLSAQSTQENTTRNYLTSNPDGTTLKLSGIISIGLYNALVLAIQGDKIKEVIVDSKGGDVESAIKIARLIRDKNVLLTVDGACISSCANYIFTAAKRKRVLIGSLLAYHGSILTNQKLRGNFNNPMIELTASLERSFFDENGINLKLFSIWDDAIRELELSHLLITGGALSNDRSCKMTVVWAPNRKDLEQFGVLGIEEFWYPSSAEEFLYQRQNTGMANDLINYSSSSDLKIACKK